MSGKSVLGGLSAFQWKKDILTNILVSLLVPSGAEQQPRVLGAVIRRPRAKSRVGARQHSPTWGGLELGPVCFTGREHRDHFERSLFWGWPKAPWVVKSSVFDAMCNQQHYLRA